MTKQSWQGMIQVDLLIFFCVLWKKGIVICKLLQRQPSKYLQWSGLFCQKTLSKITIILRFRENILTIFQTDILMSFKRKTIASFWVLKNHTHPPICYAQIERDVRHFWAIEFNLNPAASSPDTVTLSL